MMPEMEEILSISSKESEQLLQAFTPLLKGKGSPKKLRNLKEVSLGREKVKEKSKKEPHLKRSTPQRESPTSKAYKKNKDKRTEYIPTKKTTKSRDIVL